MDFLTTRMKKRGRSIKRGGLSEGLTVFGYFEEFIRNKFNSNVCQASVFTMKHLIIISNFKTSLNIYRDTCI